MPNCEVTQAVTGLYESGVISNSLRDWIGADGAPFTNLGITRFDESIVLGSADGGCLGEWVNTKL